MAQTPNIVIKPHVSTVTSLDARATASQEERRVAFTGMPILGYLLGPESAELHAVIGTVRDPQLGERAVVPKGTERLYLPPRQQYALLEQTSDEPLAVWTLHPAITDHESHDLITVPGAMSHPDRVSFRPRGGAAALAFKTRGILQVTVDLPAKPSLSRKLFAASLGDLARIASLPDYLAVTSDGAAVVAADSSESVVWSIEPRGGILTSNPLTYREYIKTISGSGWGGPVYRAFSSLWVVMGKDANRNPLSGASVIFSAPSTGASGTLASDGARETVQI
jgi:hypothetical protein